MHATPPARYPYIPLTPWRHLSSPLCAPYPYNSVVDEQLIAHLKGACAAVVDQVLGEEPLALPLGVPKAQRLARPTKPHTTEDVRQGG